jgi:Zn-dependent protease
MDSSIKIGKIVGVDIELHWSFLLLLAFTLFIGYTFFALIVLLFICVLIHEVAHTISAQRNKIKVKKIILLPLGGASIIDDTNMPPEVEFNISVSGPVMSLLIGCIFGVLVVVSPPGWITLILQELFGLNILLGVFNLLPALPTDGGRVFRSYFRRTRSEYDATMLTINVGRYVMVLIMVGTVAYLALISASFLYKEIVFFSDLLVVVFLYGGANSERELAELKRSSKGLTIKDAFSSHYVFVAPETKIADLYGIVKKSKEHILITQVAESYAYVNLLKRIGKPGAVSRAIDIATPIPSLDEASNVIEALQKMESNESGLAVVLSGKKLIGVVTLSHLQTFISLHVLSRKVA